MRKRWCEHAADARNGKGYALHAAIRKYGFDNFKKEILVTSTFAYVKELEVRAIAAYNTMVGGYNLTEGGDGTNGYTHTAETKQRVSSVQKGRVFTEEHKRKLSEARKGKTMSEEQKQKIRAAVQAVPRSAEWCANISKAKKGKTYAA